MSNNTPTPAQIRAALGLLNWEYKDLSKASGVSVDTLSLICLEKHEAQDRTREKIRRALELSGLEFLENNGLRERPRDIEIYEGPERFDDFTQFMYTYLRHYGGEICISATDERWLQAAFKNIETHRTIMRDLVKDGRVHGRVLVAEGAFVHTWAQLRRRNDRDAGKHVSFITFGDCLALISLEHNPSPYVVLHKEGAFASEYKCSFNADWERASVV